uniref:Chloride anion exchanger-like n=1 Tax=Astyanax mexicanus TaxID=7994 RepID=A0A8B9HFG0_ASTMX
MIEPVDGQYMVARPLFSEDSFSGQYKKVYRPHKGLLDNVKDCFHCDSKRAKNAALSLLPIIGWIKTYRFKEWLLGDIVAGVSTGLVSVLQGLAFALLASIPPGYGLYAAFFPALMYIFLGTSKHISVGPFPVLSLMVGAVVTKLVPSDGPPANITGFEGLTMDQQRVIVASSVTFLMGIFQLAMGVLRVGFIVIYLSDTLVSGFTTAAAVHILVSQLKFVLGLTVPGFSGPLNMFYTLESIFLQITSTNIADLITSIVIMAVVFVVKEINDRYRSKLPVPIPIEIIITIIVCGVSYGANFEERFNVTVIGTMVNGTAKAGNSTPSAPNVEVMQHGAVDAFTTAIVGFAVAFSVAKVYSVKHDYVIDGNQELIAFGASNMFGAAFQSFAASTALSRTAVQESTGGKTQIAGLVSAMIALIVTVGIGFLLEPLPRSVLGALVIVNLKGMLMQFREIPYLWTRDKADFVIWMVTCVASIILGLDLGLAVGIVEYNFGTVAILFNICSFSFFYLQIYEPEGVKIFKIPSPIFFANIEFFRDKLIQVGFSPLRVLRKRNKALRKIRKMLKNGDLQMTPMGLKTVDFSSTKNWDDEGSAEDLDQPVDFSDLPVQVNWRAELPGSISVPPVDIHSLVLDFSAVSFIDISALKGLKTTLKEFVRVDVEVYIVACDVYVFEKLHNCMFFDDEIKTSMFYPTIHDAMLHILEKNQGHSKINENEKFTFPFKRNGIITFDHFLLRTLY